MIENKGSLPLQTTKEEVHSKSLLERLGGLAVILAAALIVSGCDNNQSTPKVVYNPYSPNTPPPGEVVPGPASDGGHELVLFPIGTPTPQN